MDHSNHDHGQSTDDIAENLNDPICGMTVTRESAVAIVEHNHKTFGFCSDYCHKTFLGDPGKYST